MPQTAAELNGRVAVMKLLREKYARIAWTVCVDQFGEEHQTGG